MNKYFLNPFRRSKIAQYTALIAVIVRSFLFPPFPIIIIPFLPLFILQFLQPFNFQQPINLTFPSLIPFLPTTLPQRLIIILILISFFLHLFLIN
ncbi:DUF456 family protein [Staphylococcus epidermidis]|uniref:DUF456 family protein n=1 Tax=Staphylococcus epidermidis TaxID=1282 RepID=UPI0037D9D236